MLKRIVMWFRRKPISRSIAKLRLLYLMKKYHRLNIYWAYDKTNMHLAILKLLKAKIVYYRTCFEPWGKYRPECAFDSYAVKSYNKEADLLGLHKMDN